MGCWFPSFVAAHPGSKPTEGGIRCRHYNYGEAVVFVAAPSRVKADGRRHEMPPLQRRGAVVFVAAPSHGAVRFLVASAGGMRCRHYNYGEAVVFVAAPSRVKADGRRHEMPPLQRRGAVVFVAAPSHGAVRFLVASSGGMRCRHYDGGEHLGGIRCRHYRRGGRSPQIIYKTARNLSLQQQGYSQCTHGSS